MSDKHSGNNEQVLNRLTNSGNSSSSDNVWQDIAREFSNGGGMHGHIRPDHSASGKPDEQTARPSDSSSTNFLPAFSDTELNFLQEDLKEMRRHWNEVQPNGDHIKSMGGTSQVESTLPQLTIANTENQKGFDGQQYSTTNVAKRDEFGPVKLSGKPSAFEPAVDELEHSTTNLAKRDEFGPVKLSGKPSAFEPTIDAW